MKGIFILVLLIGAVCLSNGSTNNDTGNANALIDALLKDFHDDPSMKSKVDPVAIPNVDTYKFKTSNGKLVGLSNLYRDGDCTLSYDTQAKVLSLSAQLGVRDLKITTDYAARPIFYWMNGEIEIAVSQLVVKMDVAKVDHHGKLNSFKVVNLGKYEVTKFTGSKIFDWMLKMFSNALIQLGRSQITSALENEGAKALGEILSKMEFPF